MEVNEEDAKEDGPTKRKSAKAALRYAATVEVTGKQLVTVEVEAESKANAAKLLKARAAELEIDSKRAEVKRRIKTIKKAQT